MRQLNNIIEAENKGFDLQQVNINKRIFTMNSLTMSLISKILSTVLGLLSPQIKSLLTESLRGLYKNALTTPSPLDDLGIKTLCELLSIDISDIHL